MSSPIVESVTVPILVEQAGSIDDHHGFPFDRDFDRNRDTGIRSQLDDLAQRHPELAQHFEGFPFTSSARPPRQEQPDIRSRFGDRAFGSRFDRFFPETDSEFYQQPQQFFNDAQSKPEAATSDSKPEAQPEVPVQAPVDNSAAAPEAQQQQDPERKIQQSNTVDLGQIQEPVNDRNQRSMSAPPTENRTGPQRFVSSINIPVNSKPESNMGAQQSQAPSSNPSAHYKPTERVIPIHVEGRDEPVLPKQAAAPTESSRIFGQKPEQFTQFVRKEPPRMPEDVLKEQQQEYQKAQQQKYQQEQAKQPEAVVPPQPQQMKPATPIDMIQLIQKDVSKLMLQVEQFTGKPKDKQYLYLDEMLTRNLLKLDDVDTQGQENIRSARKEAVRCIERCIGVLEAKAAANVAVVEELAQPMEAEVVEGVMEVEAVEEATQASTDEAAAGAGEAVEGVKEEEQTVIEAKEEKKKK